MDDEPAPESDPTHWLPMTGLTLDQARALLAGWHFAKESLTEGEVEILYVAEAILRELDRRSPKGYAR